MIVLDKLEFVKLFIVLILFVNLSIVFFIIILFSLLFFDFINVLLKEYVWLWLDNCVIFLLFWFKIGFLLILFFIKLFLFKEIFVLFSLVLLGFGIVVIGVDWFDVVFWVCLDGVVLCVVGLFEDELFIVGVCVVVGIEMEGLLLLEL